MCWRAGLFICSSICIVVTEFYYFVEISLITLHWFLTVFSSVLHPRILLRVWDLLFYHGSVVLFQITLGMLKMKVLKVGKEGNTCREGIDDITIDGNNADLKGIAGK